MTMIMESLTIWFLALDKIKLNDNQYVYNNHFSSATKLDKVKVNDNHIHG